MSDRSVAIELRLKAAGYLAGLGAAKKATREFGAETLKATKQNHASMQMLGRGALLAGGGLAAGLGLAVKASMDFEKSLSGVRAVAGATAGEMDALKKAAIVAGQATVFSASQSAQAEAELAKAGISVKDILGGALTGSLNLAAAGQLDLADAATLAAQAMNIFKLKGADVSHVADVLAAGANKSAADVGQLGDALRQGGLLAAQTGLSLEDTVGALSAFADNALIGSDAGTSLKTMLQRLVPQSATAKAAMDKIGFSAYDAQGNFVGLESVAQQLQTGLGKLSAEQRSAALSTIFGSDAVRGANILYDEGAAGVRDYTSAVNDQGAASRMAAVQLDNLAGDLEQLKGSIETALIQSGSAGNDSLRGLAQGATSAVNAISGMPGPIQKSGFALAAAGASGLLLIGVLGTMLPKIRAGRAALQSMGAAGVMADKGIGRAAAAAGKASIALVALAAIGQVFNGADAGFSRWSDEIEAAAGPGTQAKITALTKEMERLRAISDKGLNTDLGFTNIHWTDWTNGAAAAGDKADALSGTIAELKHQMKLAEIEQKTGTGSATQLADAYKSQVAPAVVTAEQALKSYTDALTDTTAIDAYTSTAELAKSFRELSKELKDGGKVTNDEKITLGGFADKVKTTAAAVLDQTKSQTKANKSARDGRKEFEQLAIKAGYSATAAHRLARRLIEIPKRTDATVELDIDPALRQIRILQAALQSTGVSVSVSAGVAAKQTHNQPKKGFAAGGFATGPGTGTSDSFDARLSNGEFVINAAATSRNRGLLEGINSGGQPANGGYVNGGGGVTVVRVPVTETHTNNSPIHIGTLNGGLAEVDRQQRLRNLRAGQSRQRRQS